jgi:iron complex outermembrane receptor protein
VARTLVLLDDRQQLLGDQLEMAAAFETGSLRHDLLAGVELRSLEDRFTQEVGLLPPIDLLEPVETASPPIVTVPPLGQAGDSSAIVVAPYVVDRVRVSTKVQAFLGARLDVLDYDDPQNATQREATRLNPLLGLTVSPSETLALHASWGTASAPPSTQVVGPREPEESRQVEVGARLTFPGGKGFAGLSLYDLRRDNIAIPDSTGLARQSGDQRSRGIELDLAAEPARGLGVHATYAFTDATLTSFTEIVPLFPPDFAVVDRSGNGAPFAPRHLLGLWTSVRLLDGLGLGLGLRHVSEQFIAEDNRHTIEGYTTFDVAVSCEVGRLGLRLHLKNLTGTEYETRGFGSSAAIPARPFEALARVELRLGAR